MGYRTLGHWRAGLVTALAVSAAAWLPGLGTAVTAAAAAPAAEGERRSVRIETSVSFLGRHTRVQIYDGKGYELDIDADGEFAFNADETDLVSVADELTIEETRDGVTREIAFEADGDGFTRTYSVDGDAHPYGAEAKAWLARMIPELLRQTGIGAEQRVARIHARGGADAVLDEIDLITSDHVTARYLGLLFVKPGLSAAQLGRAVEATRRMDSDYERRSALVAALKTQQLDAERQVALLGVAGEFDSDYERREVLSAAAPGLSDDERVRTAWFDALDRSESDYERRAALEALFETVELQPALLQRAIASTTRMDSDYERRAALEHVAARIDRLDPAIVAYARATAGMESDYERRAALEKLLETARLNVTTAGAVLDAIQGMESDYEASTVLIAVAERMPADAELIRRYRAIARQLDDHDRGRAERALDRFEI